MDEKVLQSLMEYIVGVESKKTVGSICKRIELLIVDAQQKNKKEITLEELNALKGQLKELIYESFRNIRDMVNTAKIAVQFTIKK